MSLNTQYTNTKCMKDILSYIIENIDINNNDTNINFDISAMKSYCESKYSQEEIKVAMEMLSEVIQSV